MGGHSKGKRVGARAPRARSGLPAGGRLGAVVSTVGITLTVVAWGYLVWAAIAFGTRARGGDAGAWGFLGLAAVGAVACLFVALLLLARLVHTAARSAASPAAVAAGVAPRPVGGKRAAR